MFDHEGFPNGTGEIPPHTASLWGNLYNEVGEHRWPALLAWTENGGHTVDSDGLPDQASFEDAFMGEYSSFSDFLVEPIEAMQAERPEEAVRYFDWDAFQRDARFDYTVLDAPGGGVYVFSY